MRQCMKILFLLTVLVIFTSGYSAYTEEKPKEGNSLEQVVKTVVSIKTRVNKNGQLVDFGMGSGVLIGPNGIILTNYHVCYKADKIFVKVPDEKFKNKDFEARIIKTSKYYDLAILTIATPNLPYAKIQDPGNIQTGIEVRAVGNPMGLDSTITKGIVSAIRTNKDMGIEFEQIPDDAER